MIIRKVGLQQFRNINSAFLELSEGVNFFVGPNGQGKTNFLESISLITALRSFRSSSMNTLIQDQHTQALLYFEIEHETRGQTEIKLELFKHEKSVSINGYKIARLNEFIGQFPVVIMSFEDLQLIRGAPAGRRRFLDMTLAATDLHYLECLQHYHKALEHRNRLLKQPNTASTTVMASFENILAQTAVVLMHKRKLAIQAFNRHLADTYTIIASKEEEPWIDYKIDYDSAAVEMLQKHYFESRPRDFLLKATQNGPHRDDLIFKIKKKEAHAFASEGQQRSLVVSLKYSQVAYFYAAHAVMPVVLADDVLGQLDKLRSENFWKALGNCKQVVATGTVAPAQYAVQRLIQVDSGTFFVT